MNLGRKLIRFRNLKIYKILYVKDDTLEFPNPQVIVCKEIIIVKAAVSVKLHID